MTTLYSEIAFHGRTMRHMRQTYTYQFTTVSERGTQRVWQSANGWVTYSDLKK